MSDSKPEVIEVNIPNLLKTLNANNKARQRPNPNDIGQAELLISNLIAKFSDQVFSIVSMSAPFRLRRTFGGRARSRFG